MLVATTHRNLTRPEDRHHARGIVTVQEVRGPFDLIAHLLAEHGCRHDAERPGICLIGPPKWTWHVGAGPATLGALVSRLGHWAFTRQAGMPEVWSATVDAQILIDAFGWSPQTVDWDSSSDDLTD